METAKINSTTNEVVNEEKSHSQLDKILEAGMHEDDVIVKDTESLEKDQVPEIVNIYDHIYGTVQNKLDFYEEKSTESRRTSIADFDSGPSRSRKTSLEYELADYKSRKSSVDSDGSLPRSRTKSFEDRRFSLNRPLSMDIERRRSMSRKISVNNGIRKSFSLSDASFGTDNALLHSTETSPTLIAEHQINLLNECRLLEQEEMNGIDEAPNDGECVITEAPCMECQKNSYPDERLVVLSEVNSQLKVDLENANENLQKEALKITELTSKIESIENVLEEYHKDTKNNKSHFGTLYSAMKDYVVDQKYDYTYKKVKSIANYIDNLKNTLDNQNKIIKNNFLENPYTTDLMVKHAFLRKQLDEMCKENEYLKEELKYKTAESIDMIKELNRQKFEVETKYMELDKMRESENMAHEDLQRKVRLRHEQQMQELKLLLLSKDQDKLEMKKKYEAMLNNYITENSILYGKLRQQNKA